MPPTTHLVTAEHDTFRPFRLALFVCMFRSGVEQVQGWAGHLQSASSITHSLDSYLARGVQLGSVPCCCEMAPSLAPGLCASNSTRRPIAHAAHITWNGRSHPEAPPTYAFLMLLLLRSLLSLYVCVCACRAVSCGQLLLSVLGYTGSWHRT